MLEWFTGTIAGKFISTFFISMLPVVELRLGLPYGIALGLDYPLALTAAVLGNMLPVPFIILFIRQIFAWMRRHMPKLDGFSACKEIKKIKDIPIIMLSARGEEYDKLFGFELGIDDYVVKPFSPKELIARVNAVISRNKASAPSDSDELSFGGLVINMPARTVTIDGEKAELTPKEYELLFYLVKNRNLALSRDKLLQDIWGYDFFGDDRTIDTHIKNLRNNLGPYRDYIVTLRGVGYKFEVEN